MKKVEQICKGSGPNTRRWLKKMSNKYRRQFKKNEIPDKGIRGYSD